MRTGFFLTKGMYIAIALKALSANMQIQTSKSEAWNTWMQITVERILIPQEPIVVTMNGLFVSPIP